jgi:aldose 1-epimerase
MNNRVVQTFQHMRKLLVIIPVVIIAMISCNPRSQEQSHEDDAANASSKGVSVAPFGKMADGTPVSLYTLSNGKGMIMKAMNYGGIVVSLIVPDRNGKPVDVILGFDSLSDYQQHNPFFGALVGRYGNRIAKGKFSLDGKEYDLVKNNNGNHLHGGTIGFDKVFWKIEEVPASDGVAIRLSYLSKDMEEGYPGNLQVEVTYTLTTDNTVKFDYKATSDKKTIVNLTQHTYFNFNGGKGDILSHEVSLNADHFLPVDGTLIPTGELRAVEDTPFDFRTPFAIGERIGEKNQQLEYAGGYDHCWVLNGQGMKPAAVVYDSLSGIEMTVETTEPGIQFYTGNFLDGTLKGKNDVVYRKRTGFCLETEHFPDSPNHSQFPSVVLSPGDTYATHTTYHFEVRE